jgi:hypothetical protein
VSGGQTVECLSAAVWPLSEPARRHQHLTGTLRHFRAGFVYDEVDEAPRFLVTGAGGQIGTELLHLLRCDYGVC